MNWETIKSYIPFTQNYTMRTGIDFARHCAGNDPVRVAAFDHFHWMVFKCQEQKAKGEQCMYLKDTIRNQADAISPGLSNTMGVSSVIDIVHPTED